MDKVFVNEPGATRKTALKLGKRFAGGAAGDIHKLPNVPGKVAKIYKTDKDRLLYAPKLKAMIQNPPKLDKGGSKFPQVAWPISSVEDENGKFIGFVMPEVDFEKSKSLENMLQTRMRKYHKLPENYGYRLSAAFNLTIAVAALHAAGHQIIDLKPTNCRLDPKRMLISIVDTDGFSISGAGKERYHADQFTPEYIAPEALKKDARAVSETIGEQQDLFALGVIIFRLLNNGLHPFQALLPKGSTSELTQMIEKGYYAYGLKKRTDCLPAKQSIHSSFSRDLRKFFDRAFESKDRPTAKEWQKILQKYADKKSGKLIQCNKDPDHAYFTKSGGCGWCRLKTGRGLKGKSRVKSELSNTRRKKRGQATLPKRSSINIQLNTLYPRLQGKKLALIIGGLLFVNFLLIQPEMVKDTVRIPKETKKDVKKFKGISKRKAERPSAAIPDKVEKVDKSGFLLAKAKLRTGRSTSSRILIELPKGAEIWVLAKVSDGWYQVELRDSNRTLSVRGFIRRNAVALLK